ESRELSTEKIGQIVMEELKNLDRIAYVRFASVYRRFEDIDEFVQEVKNLLEHK
ncbi:MAG: ATP cone domain-containing protein, partial [Thermoanaerobaculia bacterium]